MKILLVCALTFLPCEVLAQSPHPAPEYYYQTEELCGHGFVVTMMHNFEEIDAADTAGDNDRVVTLTRAVIESATQCLVSLPTTAPSSVRVNLRNDILGGLVFEMNSMRALSDPDGIIGSQLMGSEARIATDQCKEPDLLQAAQPYQAARTMVGTVLNRDEKILAYSNTPVDPYKDELRICAQRLGVAVTF